MKNRWPLFQFRGANTLANKCVHALITVRMLIRHKHDVKLNSLGAKYLTKTNFKTGAM